MRSRNRRRDPDRHRDRRPVGGAAGRRPASAKVAELDAKLGTDAGTPPQGGAQAQLETLLARLTPRPPRAAATAPTEKRLDRRQDGCTRRPPVGRTR